MIKVVMSLIFMIPLCFYVNYWFILLLLLFLSFMVLINIRFSSLLTNLSHFCGIDLLLFTLILLRFWICRLIILASENFFKINNYYGLFLFLNLTLLLRLLLDFRSLNFFIFYLFFEISLIPTLFLIIGWGYQPERVTAGVCLLFYRLLVSLPIIVALFYLYNKFSRLEIYFFSSINNLILYYCVNMVFLVKIPIFFFIFDYLRLM